MTALPNVSAHQHFLDMQLLNFAQSNPLPSAPKPNQSPVETLMNFFHKILPDFDLENY
jgi:hypothetical protein